MLLTVTRESCCICHAVSSTLVCSSISIHPPFCEMFWKVCIAACRIVWRCVSGCGVLRPCVDLC